jgi:hypothetical protein
MASLGRKKGAAKADFSSNVFRLFRLRRPSDLYPLHHARRNHPKVALLRPRKKPPGRKNPLSAKTFSSARYTIERGLGPGT